MGRGTGQLYRICALASCAGSGYFQSLRRRFGYLAAPHIHRGKLLGPDSRDSAEALTGDLVKFSFLARSISLSISLTGVGRIAFPLFTHYDVEGSLSEPYCFKQGAFKRANLS